MQFMRQTVDGECFDDRIARNNLGIAVSSGVTIIGCLHVSRENCSYLGQPLHQFRGKVGSETTLTGNFLVGFLVTCLAEAQTRENLIGQQLVESLHVDPNVVGDCLRVHARLSIKSGEENSTRQINNLFKRLA